MKSDVSTPTARRDIWLPMIVRQAVTPASTSPACHDCAGACLFIELVQAVGDRVGGPLRPAQPVRAVHAAPYTRSVSQTLLGAHVESPLAQVFASGPARTGIPAAANGALNENTVHTLDTGPPSAWPGCPGAATQAEQLDRVDRRDWPAVRAGHGGQTRRTLGHGGRDRPTDQVHVAEQLDPLLCFSVLLGLEQVAERVTCVHQADDDDVARMRNQATIVR